MTLASYVVEVLDRFTYEEGANPGLYRLLSQSLNPPGAMENTATVVRYYEIRLLDLLGYRPQLFNCIDCGTEIQAQDQFFSPLGGGVACPACGRMRAEAWPIDLDVLRYWRHFQRRLAGHRPCGHP
jgi:DNA repair protein RecO (recombination protein O)